MTCENHWLPTLRVRWSFRVMKRRTRRAKTPGWTWDVRYEAGARAAFPRDVSTWRQAHCKPHDDATNAVQASESQLPTNVVPSQRKLRVVSRHEENSSHSCRSSTTTRPAQHKPDRMFQWKWVRTSHAHTLHTRTHTHYTRTHTHYTHTHEFRLH